MARIPYDMLQILLLVLVLDASVVGIIGVTVSCVWMSVC